MKSLCLCLSLMITNAVASGDDFPAYVRITGHPNDAKVYAALEELSECDIPGNPLKDAVEFLSQIHAIPIVLDTKALAEIGLDANSEVTWKSKGTSLRENLDRNLPEKLGFMVDEGTLKITAANEVQAGPDIRMYYFPGDHTELFDELVHAIEVTFETGARKDGDTSIAHFGNFLIVKETPATHRKIEQLLETIKNFYYHPER